MDQTGQVLERFPHFELSYETVSHKKVSPNLHNVALAIPHGKKYYAWFSYDIPAIDTIYMMELNKEKRITKVTKHVLSESQVFQKLFLGTILYGVLIQDTNVFVVEDIIQYSGYPMKNMSYGEKLPLLVEFMESTEGGPIRFRLPAIWAYRGEHEENMLPSQFRNLPYQVHHIQYRALNEIAPLLNYPVKTFGNNSNHISHQESNLQNAVMVKPKPRGILDQVSMMRSVPCYTKPQYRMPTVFHVCADIQYDIYHLFAYGKGKSLVYYDLAYIPNYNTSRFMNSLFRNIRENQNLDAIEESDDENDFQNTAEDKYVDLNKILLIEFRFHTKFRRWVPLRQVSQPCKIVHISQL